ncbi:MAG: hypothetical protein ACKO2P_05340 [Planctomycetota bacterium]
MAENRLPDDSGSLTRILHVPRVANADAGIGFLHGLRHIHHSRIRQYRDQLRPRPATAEDLTHNALYRLLTALLHGAPDLQKGFRMFLRLAGAILETQIAEQIRGSPLRRLGTPKQPLALHEFLDQLRSGSEVLPTFRGGLLLFFSRLLSHPEIAEELRQSLAELACNVLSGEYPDAEQLAEKLEMSRSRLRLRFHLLLAVASPGVRRSE